MTTTCRSAALVLLAIAGVAGSAHATDGPLLVAVDVAPGVDVAADDVRQAVASELGTPVIGAREPTAAAASDVLLVGLDTHELRMSLRAGAAPTLSRTISTPSDRPGRLRSIGWLAGNLVRDQIGPIIAMRDPPAPGAEATATQPPPLSTTIPTRDAKGPDAVLAAESTSAGRETGWSTWAVTVGGGPTFQPFWDPQATPGLWGTMYHVDVQHQASPDSWLLGATLEVGPSGLARHYLGAAALVGSGWHGRRLLLEGTVGLGLEAVSGSVLHVSVTNNAMTGVASETTTSFEAVPGLYARVQGTSGVRLSQAFDLVAQIGAHLSSTGELGSYLSGTVGVRLRLP
jgi:hypothetical protein